MSRYCGSKDTTSQLNAAQDWLARCIYQRKSIFTDDAIWTLENFRALDENFTNSLDEGDGKYIEKLEACLSETEGPVKKLVAEMTWFMVLCLSNAGVISKRKSIMNIWAWSGEELDMDSPYLSDQTLKGIGSGGPSYNVNRWRELIYFIQLVIRLFEYEGEVKTIFSDAWGCAEWVDQLDGYGHRQFRYMLLYLLFPDVYERIFSRSERQKIVRGFLGKTPKEIRKMTELDIDKAIHKIRTEQERELESDKLDFYISPLKDGWIDPKVKVTLYDEAPELEVDLEKRQATLSNGPLNSILYGPPGTGKTYQTLNRVLRILDPKFLEENIESRERLKERYEQLKAEGRVDFVTFHQSYGYEEFIEGLRADTDDKGQISYRIEDGTFKAICIKAQAGVVNNDTLDACVKAFIADIDDKERIKLKTSTSRDFYVEYHGHTTLRVFPVDSKNEDNTRGYPVSIQSIKNLYRGINVDKFYNKSYVKGVLQYLITHYQLPATYQATDNATGNYVLVVDEINRGNISKIFGELITLIEPSKRLGEEEALTVSLPYSKDEFGVPNNLYLVGTMNTADRSLAMMDTALRRRFDFIEMMPKPDVLDNAEVKGCNLEELLSIMNQRIEYLYDREHTLGHAFFIPVKRALEESEEAAWLALQNVFRNKVLPLLEEYFFEDWSKIRLVLGDNQKKDPRLQFVLEDKLTGNLDALFGQSYQSDEYSDAQMAYSINTNAFKRPSAYSQIISGGEIEEVPTQSVSEATVES
ncbi:McrB family protein [Umboniibacter marinipuniceus]|uniref:5-methylcytosine-specific restriction protein B n=1 Tax=Umboniibacter marinipuniceus TaxID=569599 RepID=A0A3M0AC26_9GAMM|nr:AAA family ATPase [Umboniibacter marinipuniceus]RMA82711.1 5-methylcytosine-specific restriction protein B [Umboniibacter marinipuniceus]